MAAASRLTARLRSRVGMSPGVRAVPIFIFHAKNLSTKDGASVSPEEPRASDTPPVVVAGLAVLVGSLRIGRRNAGVSPPKVAALVVHAVTG